jgi:hypothetical protein
MGEMRKAAAIRFFSVAMVALGAFLFAAPAALATSSDNVSGYAWAGALTGADNSSLAGWISMNCTNTATCGSGAGQVNYGVNLLETPGFNDRADLSGYAWSMTAGWICFGATCSGTTPEGGAAYAQYRANVSGKLDQFYGWAKILNMGTEGWISLNCDKDVGADDCGTSNFYVRLDNTTGNFTAGAATDHFGWGVDTNGNGAGWVDFSGVNTGWVHADLGTVTRPQGVFEPSNAGLAGTHLSTFDIGLSNFFGGVNQLLECEMLLPDGSRRVVNKTLSSARRGVGETLSYTLTNADATTGVQANKIWYLDLCRVASASLGAACVTDATCAPSGICDEGVSKCRQVLTTSSNRKPIYTHGNTWTGLNAAQDQYTAVKCNAGFTNSFFKNAAQCDYAGDASFALAMRRGIPVEGKCADGIDNDGNGQIDCADRYCKGISYQCQTLARASCTYGATGDGINDCTDVSYQSGDLCCTKQPKTVGSPTNSVVDGLECKYHDLNDGYFDCDCKSSTYGISTDCYAPGYVTGDLCCSTASQVERH